MTKKLHEMTGEEIEAFLKKAARQATEETHARGDAATCGDEKGLYRLYPDGHKEYFKLYKETK